MRLLLFTEVLQEVSTSNKVSPQLLRLIKTYSMNSIEYAVTAGGGAATVINPHTQQRGVCYITTKCSGCLPVSTFRCSTSFC